MPTATESNSTVKIAIVYYTMYVPLAKMWICGGLACTMFLFDKYHHIDTLARLEKEGMESVDGVAVDLMQVPETLPDEVLKKMGAPPKPSDVPIASAADLEKYDGVMCGTGTRFGGPTAQMKAFWDSTGSQWQSGALVGKAYSSFVSTGTQGGGQETTHVNLLSHAAHHGMVAVFPGYTSPNEQFQMSEIIGGSPYGAGTFAGADGSRQPTEMEKTRARNQGAHFAKIVKQLVKGKQAMGS